MNRLSLVLLLVLLINSNSWGIQLHSEEIIKETLIYSIKGDDTLRLDKYNIPSLQEGKSKPCLLFVFGGGFSGGSREENYNVDFVKEMAGRGYIAVAIDYRLGMKNAKNMDLSNPMAFVSLFTNTITIAVEDLFDATNFVYDHAEAWNIDKKHIIASGSSAGAFTVLQGEYVISNQLELTERLPKNFRYGGIISFAGAVFSPTIELTWPNPPSPLLLFHGDADKNVPYDKVLLGNMGIFGSKYIAGQMLTMEKPYYFYDVENAAHEIAGTPMKENLDDIESFIIRYVLNKEPLMIHAKVKQIGKDEVNKDFTLMDYIRSNY